MSPKELLYIEDALNHEMNMEKCCNSHSNMLQDGELKTFVQQLAAKHRQNYDKLFSLLQ